MKAQLHKHLRMSLLVPIWIGLILLTSAYVPVEKTVNIKAIRNFSRIYKDASDAEWQSLKDGGYVCRFTQNGVWKRAFYNNKGGWLTTIAGYTEDHLSAGIRKQLRSVYYDYSILYVHEIELAGRSVVYMVQVQDRKAIKVVKIMDGEMEEIREMETL